MPEWGLSKDRPLGSVPARLLGIDGPYQIVLHHPALH